MKRHHLLLGLVAAATLYSANASATATAPSTMLKQSLAGIPTSQAKNHSDKQENSRAQQDLQGRSIHNVVDLFDLESIARRVSGPAWQSAQPEVRRQFASVLAFTVLDEWKPELLKQVRDDGFRVSITPLHQNDGQKTALFNFIMKTGDGHQTPVTLQLAKQRIAVPEQFPTGPGEPPLMRHLDDERWVVEGLVINGQSLVDTYRDRYNPLLEHQKLAALTKKLQRNLSSPVPSDFKPPQTQVRLKILVEPYGRASDIEILRSTGFSTFDNFAVDAVRQWKFKAARRGITPIRGYALQSINFELPDRY